MPGWIEHVWKCEQCLEIIRVQDSTDAFSFNNIPPAPWRLMSILGVVGRMVVCSTDCADALRERIELKEVQPTVATANREHPVKVTLGLAREMVDHLKEVIAEKGSSGDTLDTMLQELEAAMRRARV
jgi:hypothetical protein